MVVVVQEAIRGAILIDEYLHAHTPQFHHHCESDEPHLNLTEVGVVRPPHSPGGSPILIERTTSNPHRAEVAPNL